MQSLKNLCKNLFLSPNNFDPKYPVILKNWSFRLSFEVYLVQVVVMFVVRSGSSCFFVYVLLWYFSQIREKTLEKERREQNETKRLLVWTTNFVVESWERKSFPFHEVFYFFSFQFSFPFLSCVRHSEFDFFYMFW